MSEQQWPVDLSNGPQIDPSQGESFLRVSSPNPHGDQLIYDVDGFGQHRHVYIQAKHRQAVALALLGGLTDELVARFNDGCGLAHPLSPGTVRDGLAAVFGLDDET